MFREAAGAMQRRLEKSLAEYRRLNKQESEEVIKLSRQVSALENELLELRRQEDSVKRELSRRNLNVANLRGAIKARREHATNLQNLLSDYTRNFESRLHVAELQLYRDMLDDALAAPKDDDLAVDEKFVRQSAVVDASLTRMSEMLGGRRFEGKAKIAGGLVKEGRFVMIGPVAMFRSDDGQNVGLAEQRLNSLQANVATFTDPALAEATAKLVEGTGGQLALDPTLGDAMRVERIEESLWAHIQKGGPVMIPIFALAGLALLVVLYKLIALMSVRKPSPARVESLLDAVSKRDKSQAEKVAQSIAGPGGAMLSAGVAHLEEPRALVEEVMYEQVLSTRLKLQRLLPLVAIAASAAPLLGLLGTVTGIINTFRLITEFGTGDVKTLSGGISEALITTKFGLIVAIPSLLLYALLSRKARGVVDEMEKAAVALINQISKTPLRGDADEESNENND